MGTISILFYILHFLVEPQGFGELIYGLDGSKSLDLKITKGIGKVAHLMFLTIDVRHFRGSLFIYVN